MYKIWLMLHLCAIEARIGRFGGALGGHRLHHLLLHTKGLSCLFWWVLQETLCSGVLEPQKTAAYKKCSWKKCHCPPPPPTLSWSALPLVCICLFFN